MPRIEYAKRRMGDGAPSRQVLTRGTCQKAAFAPFDKSSLMRAAPMCIQICTAWIFLSPANVCSQITAGNLQVNRHTDVC